MHDDVGEILSDLTRPDELVDNAHDASKDSVFVSEVSRNQPESAKNSER